jgi:hypothetical protein
MPVSTMNQFKGHRSRTFQRILNSTREAKAALATKRNKFHVITMRTDIHGTTKGRVPTMNHPVNVINNDLTRMKSI